MSDMKDAFGRMVGTPPPLRDVGEVLTEARRSTRRRAGLTALGSALAVFAIFGLAAVALPPGLAVPDSPPPNLAGSAPVRTDPPTARAAPVHSRQMLNLLIAAVPPGYDAWVVRRLGDDSTSAMAVGTPAQVALLAGAYVVVGRGGGQGELFAAMVSDGRAPPTGDLCAPPNTTGTAESCQVIVVGRVPIQVTTAEDPAAGRRTIATRFLWGGQLVVAAWQGVPASVLGHETTWGPTASPWLPMSPKLAELPLTARQLADLAADPAMLQFP
jgi:hypothetical protein